jgi:hypothetical protein
MTLSELRALLDFWPLNTEVHAVGTAPGRLVVLLDASKNGDLGEETCKKMLELLGEGV